jgi:hypothetical protein
MPETSKTLEEIHAEALIEFEDIQTAVRDERLQCLADRRFYSIAGAQWEGDLAEQFENKPKFEVNKIALSVMRIISEYRNNRITVDFISKEGEEHDDLADTCAGLYRADEKDSGAEEAFDNGFEEAVGGGYGAFRLRTCYEDDEDDEDERQRIRIEPIFDADSSVFFDLTAKRQDKADAKRCFVLTAMTNAAYKEEHDDDPASWTKTIHQGQFDWASPDVVFVAEYYRVEEVKELVLIYKTINGEEEKYTEADFEADDTLKATLAAIGTKKVREKKVKRKKVHKYLMSGSKILEDCGYIAGRCIPIVPVYGKRWYVDNIERCMGHVRLAKDAQRLKNMQLSKLGEISALSSVEKPILTPEQIAGHTMMWSEDNIKDYPYLLINPITDASGQALPSGPVAYTHAPQIPPAMAALLQITEQDMKDILGNQEQGEQMISNISGKAVDLIQQRLDMQTFIYVSNMKKAVRRCGEIWLSMASEIYVEEGRKMKTVGSQGEVSNVELGRTIQGEDGLPTKENDLSQARFDVDADVGPTSSSRRASTVRALTGMMTISQDPETIQVLGAMSMMNMEGEGIGEVRDFFRQKLIKMGVVKPSKEEAKDLLEAAQNQQPDANSLYLAAAAEEAKAKAAAERATTVLTIAQTEESRVKALLTEAQIEDLKTGKDRAIEAAKEQATIKANNDFMIAELNARKEVRIAEVEKETALEMARIEAAKPVPETPAPAPMHHPDPPNIYVTIEKDGNMKKNMTIKAPSGGVYKGTIEGDE